MRSLFCSLLVLLVVLGCSTPKSSTPTPLPRAEEPARLPRSVQTVPTSPVLPATPSPVVPGKRTISWEEASGCIGQNLTVCGPVASTAYAVRSNGQPTFLNLGRPYPNQGFVVVIWGRDRHKFPHPPEKYYLNKTVCVTGLIQEYRGVPQIIVSGPGQIEVR